MWGTTRTEKQKIATASFCSTKKQETSSSESHHDQIWKMIVGQIQAWAVKPHCSWCHKIVALMLWPRKLFPPTFWKRCLMVSVKIYKKFVNFTSARVWICGVFKKNFFLQTFRDKLKCCKNFTLQCCSLCSCHPLLLLRRFTRCVKTCTETVYQDCGIAHFVMIQNKG